VASGIPCRLERSEAPPERESGPVPPDALLLVLATLLLIALALGVAVVLWIRSAVALGRRTGALATDLARRQRLAYALLPLD